MQGCNTFFRITPDEANALCVFAVNRGQVEQRIDPHFYHPKFREIIKKIHESEYIKLGDVANFSTETTDFSEFEDDIFDYLEIANVDLDSNSYTTTPTFISEAPSRAKKKTQIGDICISTTRPHRGAIVEIKHNNVIASTGFSIIRKIDKSIDSRWLIYSLMSNSLLLQMLQRSSGGNYPAITEDELKKVCLPLLSISKQHKMSVFLDNALQERNQKLKQADTIRESILTNLATTLNIKISKIKSETISVVKMSQINSTATRRLDTICYDKKFQMIRKELLCSNFPVYKLKDLIVDNIGGDWGNDEENESETCTKCLVLRSTEISNKNNLIIRNEKAQYRQIEKKKLEAMNLEVGDIIIEKSGGSIDQPVGRVVFVDQLEYNCYPLAYSNFLTKIKINRNLVDPYYLFEYLRFAYGIGLTEVMQSQTNGIRNLIIEEFLEQSVVVPKNNYEIGQKMYQTRLQASQIELDAEQEWQIAKSQFEKQLYTEE